MIAGARFFSVDVENEDSVAAYVAMCDNDGMDDFTAISGMLLGSASADVLEFAIAAARADMDRAPGKAGPN